MGQLQEATTNTAEVTELLRKGITAAKAGDKTVARPLLFDALRLNPHSELAWLWLAWTAESPKEAVLFLEKVLEINPSNQQATQWLAKIRQRRVTEAPSWQCPLCNVTLQTKISKCPKCRSIIDLADIEAIINNNDTDRNLINHFIDRFESLDPEDRASNSQADFAFHFNLSLAYLNLKRRDEAVVHLREASRLKPDDNVLRAQLQAVMQQVALLKEKEKSKERPREKVVMVIDDSATIRKLVAVTLERHGYRVIAVPDGTQAFAKVEEVTPDLILLDITMPYMDGYQVCKLLKNNASTKNVPVVMLSGKDGFIDKVRARFTGASGHISKPVEQNVLLGAVQKYIKSAVAK